MTKTIWVEEETHKKLSILKIELGMKNMDELINYLLKNYGEFLMLREIKQQVKSAVQGLLKEIEEEKLNHISLKRDYDTGFYDGLDFVIERIKKWLPNIVEEKENEV